MTSHVTHRRLVLSVFPTITVKYEKDMDIHNARFAINCKGNKIHRRNCANTSIIRYFCEDDIFVRINWRSHPYCPRRPVQPSTWASLVYVLS